MLTRVDGALRPYAWGRPGGVADVLGRPVSDGGPEAEYWYATEELLLKVLAADAMLSLQVHPGPELAAAGHAREEAAGIAVDASHRSYKDRGAKTELILAVSERFEALSGFQPAAAARAALERLLASAGPAPAGTAALLAMLADDASVGDAFLWLVSEAGRPFVDALLPVVVARGEDFPLQAEIAALYPGDAGVIASLLLNHVVLHRGEVLAARTGDIHAYLRGTGIELMVHSDNVLRAGLTPKHIDLDELGRALNRAAAEPNVVAPTPLEGDAIEFVVPAVPAPIRLAVIRGGTELRLDRDALALCLGGAFDLTAAGETVRLEQGDAVRISAADALAIAGGGELVLAR